MVTSNERIKGKLMELLFNNTNKTHAFTKFILYLKKNFGFEDKVAINNVINKTIKEIKEVQKMKGQLKVIIIMNIFRYIYNMMNTLYLSRIWLSNRPLSVGLPSRPSLARKK